MAWLVENQATHEKEELNGKETIVLRLGRFRV